MLHENDIYTDKIWWRNYMKIIFTMQIYDGGMSNS